MEKYDNNDIQRTDDEIYRELLVEATDNEPLLAESPEHYRSKVIGDMTALVRVAKQDTTIRQFFLQSGRDPDAMLDEFLRRAVAKVGKN